MAMEKLALDKFEEATLLSSETTTVIVAWDDMTDRLDDSENGHALLAALGVSQAEIDTVTRILRKVQNRAHDYKNDLKAELQTGRQSPEPRSFAIDVMYQEAEAAHPGPRVFESALLPGEALGSVPMPGCH